MRWLNRSVLLCLVIVALTPAPAQAWFEWLDRLSGPGRWWGAKIDVRALCFGQSLPASVAEIRRRIAEAKKGTFRLGMLNFVDIQSTGDEWIEIAKQIKAIDARLNVLGDLDLEARMQESRKPLMSDTVRLLSPAQFAMLLENQNRVSEQTASQALDRITEVVVAIASGGIFISLCSEEQIRSFAVEFGSSWLWTGTNQQFADNESIALKTFTVGLSYRLPLPPSRDVVDLGTNVGVASFSSKGFNGFDTLTIEPFFDIHMPTASRVSKSKTTRAISRLILRTSWVFFPKGFDAGTFGPSTPRISGSEANLSFTVYYNVRLSKPTAP